ncbi:MAG: pro-sigmaK processing inhibitor BofA family protein [Anaerovoracaceae bacterium]
MGLDIGIFLTYVGAILLIFIFGRIFVWPMKVVIKLALNSLIGGAAILLVNALGAQWDIFIPLNILNALIVGVLGLPGAVLLLILQ